MPAPEILLKKQRKLHAQAEGKTPEQIIVAESAIVEDPLVVEPVVEPTEPTAEVTPVAPIVPEKPAETYEAQYRAAQGIAKKAGEDLSAAQQENIKLRESVDKLMDSIDILLAKQKEVPIPEAKPEPVIAMANAEELTDDDKYVLGEETIPLYRKLIRSEIQSFIPEILNIVESKVSKFETRVDTVVRTTEEDRKRNKFNEELYGQIPNADVISREPEFAEWAKGREDVEGNSYTGIYSKAAFTDFNAKPVINILKEYLATKPVVVIPIIEPEPVTIPNIPPELEEQIAPAKAVGSEVPGSKPKIEPITITEVADYGVFAARNPFNKEIQEKYANLRIRLFQYTESQKQLAAKGKK
jgi:hypothetical protein